MGIAAWAAAVAMVAAGAGGSGPAGRKVLLLNGFEPEVLRQWAQRRTAAISSYLRVVRIGDDGVPTGGGMVGTLVAGDATEGKFAMVREVPRTGGRGRDYSLNYLTNETTVESIRRNVGTLLNTFGTFRDFYPTDWSAYAALRFDVKSDASPLRLRVEIEDSVIVPMLRRVYQVPAGRWVTVEFDLHEAGRPRALRAAPGEAEKTARPVLGRLINLADMANLRITIEHLKGKTSVKLDNLRLVAAEARKGETELPIVTDDRPFAAPQALSSSEPRPRAGLTGRLNRAAVEWSEPVTIPLSGGSYGLVLFDVAVVDNDRMLLAVGSTRVLRTTDGGRTWEGLDGEPNKPTRVIDHDTNAPGRAAAAMGPDLMVLGTARCSGGATPVDSYSILVGFDGAGWRPGPRGLMDVDNRHCPEWHVEAVRLASGRVWAAWLHYNRFGRNDLHARYSDDGGRTWRDPAANAAWRLTTRGQPNPYAATWWAGDAKGGPASIAGAGGRIGPIDPHPPLRLAAWGEHVLCAYVLRNRLVWAFFDGRTWSAPQPTGLRAAPVSLAHLEGRLVYMAATDGKVYRLDGRKWVEDSPPGGVGKAVRSTRLSAAGKVLVAAWADGGAIRTSAKPIGGAWSAPREVAREAGGAAWLAAPVRSVENFVPLAWSVAREDRRQPGGGPGRFVRIPVSQPRR